MLEVIIYVNSFLPYSWLLSLHPIPNTYKNTLDIYFVFVAPKFSLLLPPLVIGFYQFIEAGRSQIRPFIRYSSPTNSPEMDSNLKNTERNKLQTKNKAETMTCSNTKYHGQTYSNLNDVSILQLHSHIVLFWIHVSTTLFKVKYSLVGGLRSDCLAGQNTNN